MNGRCPFSICLLLAIISALAVAPACLVAQPLPPIGPGAAAMAPEDRGDLLMLHRQYVEAIRAFGEAPQTPRILNKTGTAWHHLFAFSKARKYYQQALRARPDYPEAISNLGACYFEEQDYSKAIKYFRRAAELDSTSAIIFYNLGTTYFANGDQREGKAAYETAFALDPDIFNGDLPEIVASPVPKRNRSHPEYCVAELLARAKRSDRAIEHLQKAFSFGFRDRKRLMTDKDFSNLRDTPEFSHLVNSLGGR